MTQEQKMRFVRLLVELNPCEFHHGDCVGSDAQAHTIVRGVMMVGGAVLKDDPRTVGNCKIVVHPPIIRTHRAYCPGDETRFEKEYLIRNRRIVIETDIVVAAPKSAEEEIRSGTWSTIRYARKLGREVRIV